MNENDLLMKSKGVKDCVIWLKERLKSQKEKVIQAELLVEEYGIYEDCGESYKNDLLKEQSKLEELVEIKVGLEKYMKKLKHMSEEIK